MWKVTERQNEMLPWLVYDEDSFGFRPIADCYCLSTAEQIAAEHNQLAAVTQQRDAAVATLAAVEWVYDHMGRPFCPWCRKYQHEGHAADCERQAALVRE